MSNIPSRIQVLRRRPLATSQKLGISQTTHKGKIIDIDKLLRRVEEQGRALERAVTMLENLKLSEEPELEDLSARWQTINLVLHSFIPFVWRHIPDTHKEELMKNGMNNFLDIYRVNRGEPCPARDVGRRIYNTIDLGLMHMGEYMLIAKQDVSKRRNPLDRPDISDAAVREFLKFDLGDGNPDLQPLEIAAFDFIKETVNTDTNILEANRHLN